VELIIESILKWVMGIALGALTTLLLIFKKEILEFIKFKKKEKKTELLKDIDATVENLEEKMDKHEEDNEQDLKEHDQLFFRKLEELETRIMTILDPLRDATLSSHYDALLEKCKYFVKQGSISVDELELLERDYETYKSLGGNGHMEVWMTKIRKLPIT
jgi:hypothetical protein